MRGTGLETGRVNGKEMLCDGVGHVGSVGFVRDWLLIRLLFGRMRAMFQLCRGMERSVRMDMNETKEIKAREDSYMVLLLKPARNQKWVSSNFSRK